MSPKCRCALCGRVTLFPLVWIGSEPIGPTCARKAGLHKLGGLTARAKKPATRRRASGKSMATRDQATMDLWGDA